MKTGDEVMENDKQGKKGVSAVVYDNNGSLYFLILHRVKNWEGWEFPKGGIKDGETDQDAIVREIQEETGLKRFKVVDKLDIKREFMNGDIKHSFDIYLIEASMNIPITLQKEDPEHDTYLWTTKDRVLEKLTWPEEKEVFEKAVEEISKL